MSFVRAPNPIWYFVDLVGLGLNDEYYMFFLTNTLPYLPQNVYRDPQGMTVWSGDVVQFYPNGTLPDNLYFDPTLTYRLEVRHGNSQTDALIYEINNFVPGEGGEVVIDTLPILSEENQLANGQFSQVNFTFPSGSNQPSLTITAAGTYDVAPGWQLVLTGGGTTTLTQAIFSGNQLPASPNNVPAFPYYLTVNNSGWTTAVLQQTFTKNGSIWANGAVSMQATAWSTSVAQNISFNYVPIANGTPGTPVPIVSSVALTPGVPRVINGTVNVGASTNANLSTVATVSMQIVLPPTGIVNLTNVQVVGQSTPIDGSVDLTTVIPDYQQNSEERITDHLFHYYASQLLIKPKKSLLVGWNFPLNPFQFTNPTVATKATITSYIADQTILHQEAASQVQTGANSIGQRADLLVKAVTAATTTRFALIQYIDPRTVRPYWSYIVSAFARARIFTTHGTSVRLKCRLIYRASLPSTIGNNEPIASWGANADPVFAAGWTALSPLNDPAYVLPNAYSTDETTSANAYPGFSFNSFKLPDATNANMTLGIVVYTMDNMDASAGTEDSIGFDKISLIPSYFGADALPQTFDDCLKECEFYYEKSYSVPDLPGAITLTDAYFAEQYVAEAQGDNPFGFYSRTFNIPFKRTKRTTTPTVTIYSPTDGASGQVHGYVTNGSTGTNDGNLAITNWSQLTLGQNNVSYHPVNTTRLITTAQANNVGEAYFLAHYTLDARLGV